MVGHVVVTGAFSYTGAAVAGELIRRGVTVRTLTNRQPPPGSVAIPHAPLRMDGAYLTDQLKGADALVNTYWIRLPHGRADFGTAVRDSRILIEAATRAGVRRLVYVSVSNAGQGHHLGYYAGKAAVEQIVRECDLSHAIVRPTLIVGPCDVLTNNIAWFLRRFPAFLLPDGGGYRLQPVTLSDTARIVADALESGGDIEIDAAGPDTIMFSEYVRWIAEACDVQRPFVGVPGWLSLVCIRFVGALLRDVVLTREEMLGLEQELLVSHEPPRGRESVRSWLHSNGTNLGRSYLNDIHRHFGAGRHATISPPTRLPRLG
ncbi:MAG: NAD(P)H-binding protein [Planctomycetes bacterium]|nr:NAD(P)H-binding protein [Planctomycetota bacterium]